MSFRCLKTLIAVLVSIYYFLNLKTPLIEDNLVNKKLECSQISNFLRFKMVSSSSLEKSFMELNFVQKS